MTADLNLLQPYWLLLLPFPWLWLYWRLRYPVSWPQILPMLTMRYPLLDDLQTLKQTTVIEEKQAIRKKAFDKRRRGHSDLTMAIVLCFMIMALSQPVHYGTAIEQNENSEPVDLILVIDTALSMSLSDYEIQGQAMSRLGMSQLFLKDFIKHYSGRRIGLVLLGDPPALWLPLTTDKAVVQDALKRITTLLGGRLSDMGATLNLIHENFKDEQEKVIVLISDGGVQIGSVSPNDAVAELTANGFTLYGVAVGSSDSTGSLDNTSLIYQPVNLMVLNQLIDVGNGEFFHAINTQAFSDALQTIEQKHRKPLQRKEAPRLVKAWYPLPLSIALFLLLYAVFIQHKADERVSK